MIPFEENQITPYQDRRTTKSLFEMSPEIKRSKKSNDEIEFVSSSPATKKRISRYMTKKNERLENERLEKERKSQSYNIY